MKSFDELPVDDQLQLCLEVFRAMAAAHAADIRHTAEIRGESPAELWRQICREASLEECEPWTGYPHRLLPEASGFWTRLGARSDDVARRRVRGLRDLVCTCLSPSGGLSRESAASAAGQSRESSSVAARHAAACSAARIAMENNEPP